MERMRSVAGRDFDEQRIVVKAERFEIDGLLVSANRREARVQRGQGGEILLGFLRAAGPIAGEVPFAVLLFFERDKRLRHRRGERRKHRKSPLSQR